MSNSNAFTRKNKVGAGSLALLVGAGTLFTAATPAFAAPGDPVALDASLQACINEVLGQQPTDVITEGQLAGLTGTLTCQGFNLSSFITSLDGLEHATGLTGLNLNANNISDLTPISGLTALTSLNVSGNSAIDSVAPLAGLTNLTELRAANLSEVNDWATISGLTDLTYAYFHAADITDVSFLSGMTNLQTLSLTSNENLSDLSPLSSLSSLNWLLIGNTAVTDFDDVGQISSLSWLDADELNITDFTGLYNLPNLEELVLAESTSDVWGQLSALTVPLEYLYLSGDGITDISWINGLSVEYLTLYDTPLTSLADVAGVQNLFSLAAEHSGFTDVSPLAGLTSLDAVYLNGNHIADLSPLEALDLTTLSASNQTIQANATTGNLLSNPIVNLDGSTVVFPDSQYLIAADGFMFDDTDAGVFSTSWSTPTPSSSSSVTNVFSGTLSVNVSEVSEDLPAPVGLQVFRNADDPAHSVILNLTPADAAASYTFTLTPVSDTTADPVTFTYIPQNVGEFPINGEVVGGLKPATEYSVSVYYTDVDGNTSLVTPSAEQAPLLHTTDFDDVDNAVAPALTDIVVVATEDKPNSMVINFPSLESRGGTGGFGEAVLYTVDYRMGDGEWMTLTTEGSDATDTLTLSNIPAGTYEIRVSYSTDTGVDSEVASYSDIVVFGAERPDGDGGDGTGTPAAPAADANNLNNSASNMNMEQVGLLTGGGLLLAAAGALMLGARRSQRNEA